MNKKLFRTRWYAAALLMTVIFWMARCTPEKGPGVGPLPKPAFTVSGGGNSNSVTLVNTTPGANIAYWSSPGQPNVSGDSANFRFTFQGVYPVTLTVVAQGGLDTLTQQVTINQNDPTACTTSMQGFIAGCSQKVWMLDPIASGEMIGPSPGSDAWWGNGATEPTGDRVCDFDDTYTFSFNSAGTFVYNNQGDYYTEGYLGNSNNDCDVNTDLSAADQPWASGNFSYLVIPNAGSAKLGQLQVIGLGAHIGLPRVENGSDLSTDLPVNSVTYDIIDTAHNAAGYDVLTLSINGTGGDWWTWVLRSY